MLVLRKETPEEYLDDIRKQRAQNAKDLFGIPTLCSAIEKFRSAYLVEELLKDGAIVDEFTCMKGLRLNQITRDRFRAWGEYSAIHMAASLGQYEIVRLLLDHGADLSTKTTKGVECLHFIRDPYLRCQQVEMQVTEKDDLEVLKIMKNNDLDLSKKNDVSKSTVLHKATVQRCIEIVRYLISVGFDVNCVDAFGSTPLHRCEWNNTEATNVLLDNNADPNAQDGIGNTLYHRMFVRHTYREKPNNLEFLRLLHKFNANPNIQNESGKTALHVCLENIDTHNIDIPYQLELVDFMLRQGADPNIKDIFERTPVYCLVVILNVDDFRVLDLIWSLLTKLIHFGAKLNHLDITGTPLLHVLVNGLLFYPEYFDAKLWIAILHPKYKVNLNVQDYYNRTALHLVAAKGDWNLGEIFLKHGGNLDTMDCDGNTPLDVAILCKRWEFARNLLLWPITVGQSSDFREKQASHRIDEDTSYHTRTNSNSGCKNDSNNNDNNICNNNSDNNSEGNSVNNVKNDDNNSDNDGSNNSNNNSDNGNNDDNNSDIDDNNKGNDNSNLLHCHFDKHNQKSLGTLKKVKRSSSMPSFKTNKQHDKSLTPLGSGAKWTKNKLDTVVKLVARKGNEFYPTSGKHERIFWDTDSVPPKPRISERFLTQINKSSLQRLCEENSLEFHLTTCGEEHCLLAQQVFNLVKDLVTRCSEMDSRMKSKLYLTGSSSEGTKMWLPDEFDFLMELVELQDCCYIRSSLWTHPEVILHQKCETVWSNLCDYHCVLSSEKLKRYVSSLLWKAAFELNRQKYPNIDFNLCRYDRNLDSFLNDTKVGVNLTVYWNGDKYKNLRISVDLTPAIPVVISEQQMRYFNEYAVEELSDKCIHVVPYIGRGESFDWRPSFSLIEVRIVKSLTNKQISLYKCLKFLRDLHGDLFAHIPSYHLKTFLLTTLYQNPDNQIFTEDEDFYFSVSYVILLMKQIAELDRRAIQHFFLKLPLNLLNYDTRWCKSILEHLESS